MPETCTCGTTLVENARFCHRCGRPVFPDANSVAAPPQPESAPVARNAPAKQPAPVGFGNPIALRIAFLMSIAIMVLEMIPFLQFLFVVWCLIAGWGAVRLYRRITGTTLSTSSGARLGSITGVLTFLSIAVVMALAMLFNGKELIQQMVRQNPEVSQVVNNPAALALGFLFGLMILFAMVVGTCAAGGALGARFAAGASSK
jgi:hypothetical protein